MSRIWSCGFELQGLGGVDCSTTSGSPSINKNTRRTGRAAMDCTAAGDYARFNLTIVTSRAYFAKCHLYIRQFPTVDTQVIQLGTGATSVCNIILRTSDHKLQLSTGGATSAALVLNTWYEIDLKVIIGTGATDTVEGRLNQTVFATATSANVGDTADNFKVGRISGSGASGKFTFDDVIINDDQGTDQNGYPNGGGFHFALPVADVTRDAGWLDGDAAGTTNLWDSVNNIPSTSNANSTTAQAGKRIQNAVSTTTQNYECDVQSYTEVGVPSGDTVRMVQAVSVFGNGSATGALTESTKVINNPADAGAETTVASSGIAVAWPSNWSVNRGNPLYSPTVTRSTRPRVQVGKRTASTNRMAVSPIGLMIEAIPGGGAPIPNRQAYYL